MTKPPEIKGIEAEKIEDVEVIPVKVNSKNDSNKVLVDELKPKGEILKNTFLEWAMRANVDCFVKIFDYYENSLFTKLVWTLILLASSCLSFWLVRQNILSYLTYGVTSQISEVYEIPTEFPAVTLCDRNAFTTSHASTYFNDLSNQYLSDPSYHNNFPDTFALAQMLTSDPSFGDQNRKLMGLNIDQIYTCTFNNVDCKNDLHWYWSYDFGNCFQFNVGLNLTNQNIGKKRSYIEGPNNGLQIEISPFSFENVWLSFSEFGMIAFIHNSSFKPRLSDGVLLMPSEANYIEVKRTFLSNPPKPYTDCVDLASYSSDLYDFILESNQTYRQKDCFDLCKQTSIIDACGCYYLGFANPSSNEIRPCLNLIEFQCYTRKLVQFDSIPCASNFCPLECDSIQYLSLLSSSTKPSLIQYYDYIALSNNDVNNLPYELFRTEFLRLNVFYSSLTYTQLVDSPTLLLTDLFGNIGGSLSLIVSLSFFTLFELAEFFVLLLHALTIKK